MDMKSQGPVTPTIRKTGNELADWHLGRLSPMPSHVPSGWDLVRLTSIAKLESGHTPSRRNRAYWTGPIPWVSLHDSAALDVPEICSTAQTISKLGLEHSSARLLPKGTVVFSRTATVGKATVMGCEMATSQDFANYVCGDRVHNHYLVHLFRFMAPEWKRLMAGSTHNSIYMPVFQKLQVLLPPAPEQEAIAEALSNSDSFIESLEHLIAKKRQLKQGAMHELLTGNKRLPPFCKEWEFIPLGELFTFKNGLNKAKQFFGHGTPIVNYMDVFQQSAIHSPMLNGRVALTSQELATFEVRMGDVLFTRTSETADEVGMASVVVDEPKQTVFSGFLLRARPRNQRLCNEFKRHCFASAYVRRQIISRASYTTRALTNGRILSAVTLRVPEPAEQLAIAEILNDMDAEISALEGKLAKAHNLKQGMMQQLLTGKVRLV
jgi:type I restriction enzyme S subunit